MLIALFPLMFAVVFGWFMYLSISDPSQAWYSPFATFSLGTMVLQWGVVLIAVIVLNDLFSRRTARGPLTAADIGRTPRVTKEEGV